MKVTEILFEKNTVPSRSGKKGPKKWTSSGGAVYFREYSYSALWFTPDTKSLKGMTAPFEEVKGVPNDNEDSNKYTVDIYAKS